MDEARYYGALRRWLRLDTDSLIISTGYCSTRTIALAR